MANDVKYSITLLDKFSRVAKKIKNATDKIKIAATGASRKFSQLGRKLSDSSRKMRDVGKNLTYKVSVPIALAGANMLRMSGNFELAMNNVRALSDATGSDFESLRNKAMELGESTKYTATEVANTMGVLAQAGMKTNKILGAVSPVLDLATAANMSMAESASIVTGILAGYQIKVEDLTKVNDILVQAFTNSKTDLVGLGEAFKYGGSVASAMGMSLEETSAIFATFGKRNIEASMAGTSLRGMMTRLVNPTKEAAKVFRQLKIKKSDIVDSKGNLKSLIDIIEVLQKSGMNTAQTMEVFGLRAGPAMVGLLEEGHSSIREFITLLGKAGGKSKKIANVQMSGLMGAVRSLTSAFEGLNIRTGDAGFLGIATDMVNKLANYTRKMSKADKETLKLLVTLAGIAAIIAPLIILIGLIATPVGLIVTGIGLLTAAIITLTVKWKELLSYGATKWKNFMEGLLNPSKIEKIAKIMSSVSGFFGGPTLESFNAQKALAASPVDNNNSFSGVLAINLKDREKQVKSMQLEKSGFLDVGLSTVGI